MPPALFRGQRALFGGDEIPINETPRQFKPPGGRGFAAAALNELISPPVPASRTHRLSYPQAHQPMSQFQYEMLLLARTARKLIQIRLASVFIIN